MPSRFLIDLLLQARTELTSLANPSSRGYKIEYIKGIHIVHSYYEYLIYDSFNGQYVISRNRCLRLYYTEGKLKQDGDFHRGHICYLL